MVSKNHVDNCLQQEFLRLKAKLGIGNEVTSVVWIRKPDSPVCGEVKNGTVYIYERDGRKAVETLRHELLDFLLTSRIINPFVSLVNLLIKSREAEIYKEKEKLVEVLSSLISQ